jgi:Flp pilus assembly protein TadG
MSIAFPQAFPVKRDIRALPGETSGNVAMVFGFSVLLLFGSVGGAIDYARWFNAKNKLQTAMDSASLAGGRVLQLSASGDATEAIATANTYFERMKPSQLAAATPTFTVSDNGTVVRGVLNFSVDSPFLSVLGFSHIPGRILSETVVAAGGNAGTNLEVSLMLDTTGSMEGQKILDLKDAAKDLIDIVVWSDQSQYTSKVALAPFSQRVNVGDYLQKVSDVQTTRSFSGNTLKGITCVTERTGTHAFTDEKPNGNDTLSAFSGDKGNAAKDNQSNYSTNGICTTSGWNPVEIPKIMPLSSDKDTLKGHIDALPAAGSTAGSLGTAWAWYLLSPKWTGIWQGDNLPAPYSDLTTLNSRGQPKLKKVAVLMTDGEYNTMGGSSADATTVSNDAVTLCNNMKDAGITVYTVGFQLGGSELAENTLRQCASRGENETAQNTSYFFNASSGDELRASFRQIALALSTLRIRE